MIGFGRKIKGRLESEYHGRIGPGDEDGSKMRILNGIATLTDEGNRHEGDQRHVGICLGELGLMEGSRSVSAPGGKEKMTEEGERAWGVESVQWFGGEAELPSARHIRCHLLG